jgi:hypothetical protein
MTIGLLKDAPIILSKHLINNNVTDVTKFIIVDVVDFN